MGNYAKVDCFLVVMDQFKQDCLRCHNELRKKHGVAPLVLDQQMCTVAQKKADQLASEEKMYHSGSGYGENLIAIGVQNRVLPSGVKSSNCGIQIEKYKGTFEGAGHFTQVVWKSSIRLVSAVL